MNSYYELLHCGEPEDLKSRAAFSDRHWSDADEWLRMNPRDLEMLTVTTNGCLWPVLLSHFGFDGEHSIKDWCERGCELTIDFFRQSHSQILENTTQLRWFECECNIMLMSCFCPQGMAARIASSQFLQDDWQVEAAAIPIEPALGRIALLMASEYNDKLSKEVDIRNAKPRWKRHAKSLLYAWNALKDHDSSQFVKSIAEAVEEHARKTKDDAKVPITAIAIIESAMVGRAYEKGWTNLEFPPEIAARLVTHQSLGLT